MSWISCQMCTKLSPRNFRCNDNFIFFSIVNFHLHTWFLFHQWKITFIVKLHVQRFSFRLYLSALLSSESVTGFSTCCSNGSEFSSSYSWNHRLALLALINSTRYFGTLYLTYPPLFSHRIFFTLCGKPSSKTMSPSGNKRDGKLYVSYFGIDLSILLNFKLQPLL